MRLFFALWPDGEVTRRLADAAGTLNIEGGGRFVRPQNYHLTLAFIGDVAESQLAVLQQIGRRMNASGFTVVCDSFEFWMLPQVVVTTAQETPAALHDLWARLNDALKLPRVPLRAHVTLARKVAQASVLPAMSPIIWRATHFSLIRSDSGAPESAYTVVDTWSLLYEMRKH